MKRHLASVVAALVVLAAAGAGVGAWLAVQVSETLLPLFGTPDWVLRALVLLLVLGLVPALVFAWLYELTPEGLKRDAEVTTDASIAVATPLRSNPEPTSRWTIASAGIPSFARTAVRCSARPGWKASASTAL
jgi:hypothetical protein